MVDGTMAAFDTYSGWCVEPATPHGPLVEDCRADVVIVGAGYCGMNAALDLAERGVDVVLLEKDTAGYGASGRNAGHLTPTIGKDLPTLIQMFGRDRAARLVAFAERAVDHTAHRFVELGIRCDYEPTGNLMAAVHPRQLKRLEKAAAVARELGADVDFLTEDEARGRELPSGVFGGVFERAGGLLDPGRYALELRQRIIESSVRLHEASAALEIEAVDGGVRVTTERGEVRAEQLILATNAYTESVRGAPAKAAPLRVVLFETERLNAEQRDRLGWPGREGIYTAHEVLESYHLTSRGTIVGGSKFVGYGFGRTLSTASDERAMPIVERGFRNRFPELAELPIRTFWGGWIYLPLDFLPHIGSVPDRPNMHYGIGFCGHGVAQATLAGSVLARRVLGETDDAFDLLARRGVPIPPEPLTWLVYKMLHGTLQWVDRRTDRRVARL